MREYREYRISFTANDSQVKRVWATEAESEGDAIERFEYYAERFEDGYDILGCVEVSAE